MKLLPIIFVGACLVFTGCSMQTPAVERAGNPENAVNADRDADALLLTLFPEPTGTPGAALTQAAMEQRQVQMRLEQEEKERREQEARKRAEQEAKEKKEEAERKAKLEKERKEEEERKRKEAQEAEERKRAEEEAARKKESGIVEGPLGILMGSFTTSFSGSSSARRHNIRHAAKLINGTTLAPGESFSTSSTISPISEDNGYQVAGAYQDGKVIDSVGGGVCQISTTLYNAVLAAELKVTERAEHSMTVSYVEVARDAAIAGDYKDFCFENNTDDEIHIEGWATESEVTFQIWGRDTGKKDGRSIKFETVILEKNSPGEPVITEDDSKSVDYYHETQSAHTGYKAELYKVVYQDGVEVDRVRINTSSYEASPAYAVVGTRKSE